MALAFSTSIRNNMLAQILAAIDSDASAATIRIYDGTRPASGAVITSENVLAELILTYPAAPTPANGLLDLSSIADDASANTSGTATWFRITDNSGDFAIDGDVGVTSSGADMELNSTTITALAVVSITNFDINAGNL